MNEIKCLDHGFVKLVDVMGNDQAVVQAARTSYGDGTKSVTKDEGLIRYLMRHKHTSPFEMVEFKFHCKMPMFVARQWVRHRTASINEVSARYTVLPQEQYIPEKENIAFQSKDNKQGRSEEEIPKEIINSTLETFKTSFLNSSNDYQNLLENNISREIARLCLPISQYTEWYWKIDLHNLFHFLRLRLHPHAQLEIRVYAEAISKMIQPIVPLSYKAFEDYLLNSVSFSGPEMELLIETVKQSGLKFPEKSQTNISKRELNSLKQMFE